MTMGRSSADGADDELLVIRWTGKDCTLTIPIKIVAAIKCLKLHKDILFDLFIISIAIAMAIYIDTVQLSSAEMLFCNWQWNDLDSFIPFSLTVFGS